MTLIYFSLPQRFSQRNQRILRKVIIPFTHRCRWKGLYYILLLIVIRKIIWSQHSHQEVEFVNETTLLALANSLLYNVGNMDSFINKKTMHLLRNRTRDSYRCKRTIIKCYFQRHNNMGPSIYTPSTLMTSLSSDEMAIVHQ